MGSFPSSIAIGAGTFSAGFVCFGGALQLIQPRFLDLQQFAPFYQWYFPARLVDGLSVETIARVVGVLATTLGVNLLTKVKADTKLEDRKVPLALLSAFFLHSIVGHSLAQDGVAPVITLWFLCSTSALIAIILGNDNKTDEKKD